LAVVANAALKCSAVILKALKKYFKKGYFKNASAFETL
jgi:hypothetical protein